MGGTPTVVITPTDKTPTVGDSGRATPELDPAVLPPPPPRLHRATLVQHGHSSGEHNLYMAMWSSAKPEPGRESRLLRAGYDALARIASLNEKTVRINIRRLIAKLAIEVALKEDVDHRQGRTYRIFSFGEILTRRRAAGMLWVRRTRGVEFVFDLPTVGETPTVGKTPAVDASTAGKTPPDTVGKTPPGTVGENPTLLGSVSSLSVGKAIPATPEAVVRALKDATGHADDDAVIRIVTGCRAKAPDASDEEIARYVRSEGERYHRIPNIGNPVALLIRHLPKCFEGESFRQFRETERQRREAEERRQQEWRKQALAILEDPDSSEDDRNWARAAIENP